MSILLFWPNAGAAQFVLADSANIAASGEATTAQLTPPPGKSSGTDFESGRIQDDENPTDTIALGADKYTEVEFSIKAVGSEVIDSDDYEFRLIDSASGQPLISYYSQPVGTINESSGVTVGLTGISSTGTCGALGVAVVIGLSGIAGTAAAGTLSPQTAITMAGQAATGAVGSDVSSTTIALTGASATGAVGTLTATVENVSALTGVEATGAAGAVTSSDVAAVSGEAATSAIGTLTASQGVTVALSGVVATGTAGTIASSDAAALSGVSATAATGALIATQENVAALAGVEATGAVGSVSVDRSATALSGVSAAGAVGTLVADSSADVSVALTGISGTGEIGTVAETHDGTIALTGVGGTGVSGALSLPSSIIPSIGGAWGYQFRPPRVRRDVTVALRGVRATSALGTVHISTSFTIALTPVEVLVQAGRVSTDTLVGVSSSASATGAIGPPSVIAVSVISREALPPPVRPTSTRSRQTDAVDRAWITLQRQIEDEDDLLLLGVFDA